MEPPVFLLVLANVGAVLAVTKMVLNYRLARARQEREAGAGGPDRSLTATELRGMIQESVAEATAPLQARLDRLDRTLPPAPVDQTPPREA